MRIYSLYLYSNTDNTDNTDKHNNREKMIFACYDTFEPNNILLYNVCFKYVIKITKIDFVFCTS